MLACVCDVMLFLAFKLNYRRLNMKKLNYLHFGCGMLLMRIFLVLFCSFVAQVRSTGPYYGAIPVVRGAYVGSPSYNQPIPYNYQQGFAYPQYG